MAAATALAYVIREGVIDGVEVSGLVAAVTARIPVNILDGSYAQKLYIDARADDTRAEAPTELMLGRRGGAFEEMAKLVAENLGVERVAIEDTIAEGAGRFSIDGGVEAVMRPYRGPSGKVTTLHESIFSTIPGSPAYVGDTMKEPALGIDLHLKGRNAIQGTFRFEPA